MEHAHTPSSEATPPVRSRRTKSSERQQQNATAKAPHHVFGLLVILLGCASAAPGTIGAALGQTEEHRLFVRATPEGQGAARAGILPGDEILLLDGKSVRAMSPEDVRRAVRGDVGSTLVVTVIRGGQTMEVKIVRTPLLADTKKGR